MGKKRVGESFQTLSLPKKSSRASSSSNVPSSTKGTKDAFPLILSPHTRGFVFVNEEQKLKYETLGARKTSEQKFWHVESLRTLEMLDDVVTLLSNLGWMEYMEMNCVLYARLIIEFLNTLHVD